MSTTTRYGILWSDGTFTGGITDKLSLAHAYAHKTGTTYTVGQPGDPEWRPTMREWMMEVDIEQRDADHAEALIINRAESQEEDFSDLC